MIEQSNSLFSYGVALTVFATGSIISFFWWQVGVAAMLTAAGIACLSRYRLQVSGFAGSLALVPALIISIYVYGSLDRAAPVYYTNVSSAVWLMIIVGSLCLILGMIIGGRGRESTNGIVDIDLTRATLFFWVGAAAIGLSALNYATGDIPLFSGDVNGARLGGNYGTLGRLWPLIHPVTQVSVIVALLLSLRRKLDLRWGVLGVLSAVSLLLAGGRSFIAIAIIAAGVLFLEIKRPRLQVVISAALAGILAFGIVGEIRALSSANAVGFQSYMSKRDLDSWFGSTDLSLQTGPRVLTLAVDSQNDEHLGGQIFVGDIGNFLNSAIPRSDRLITTLIGRDPSLGGAPPTLFGGLYLDFGWLGVIFGALGVGLLLTLARRRMYSTPSLATSIWFAYFTAYISVSAYSYVSIRPSWLVVLTLCLASAISFRGLNGQNLNGLEVQNVSGRRRTAPF